MLRTLTLGLSLVLLLAAPGPARSDLQVAYTVDSRTLRDAETGTSLTFYFYGSNTCTGAPLGDKTITIDEVDLIERLNLFKPPKGSAPPKTARLTEVFAGYDAPSSPLWIVVSGTGIAPVGGPCQIQYPSRPFPCASQVGNEVYFDGCNVNVRNGVGTTYAGPNGLGNLVVGYNLNNASYPRTGSHSVIVGDDHGHSGSGNLIGGTQNFASSDGVGLLGRQNVASAYGASVTGGNQNTASGDYSSVSGGKDNVASWADASVSGGQNNEASGSFASVSGGVGNTASGSASSVSGGECNVAGPGSAPLCEHTYSPVSSVSGGSGNVASGDRSTVSGGGGNIASGTEATVSGGLSRSSTGTNDWRAGTLFEDN